MSTRAAEIIQVRDVAAEDVAVLRTRAAARGMSLSGYLRQLIHDEASRPTMDEVAAAISEREVVEAASNDVRSFIEEGRR